MNQQSNKVFDELKKHKNHREVKFLEKCSKLIGMYNIAPGGAGLSYLKAAHLTGYQYLVVHRYDEKEDDCIGEFLNYKMNHIRRNDYKLFNVQTGLIDDKDGTGKMSFWYFCKRWT